MAKENTIPTRVNQKTYQDLEDALKIRFSKGLMSKKEFTMVEGFRLVNRTASWKMVLEELKNKPKDRSRK